MLTTNYHQPSRRPQAGGEAIDLTAVFRRAGLPHTVTASPAFEAKFQLRARHDRGTDHYDLLWAVRAAITGCVPTRVRATASGKVLLLELPIFRPGAGNEDVRIAICLRDRNQVHLVLPEEFPEPATYRLLVAERDEEIASLLEMMLRHEGYEVIRAATAAAALERAHQEPFDLVLLDVDLPDANAFTLCAQLRADPVTQHRPVVIISAWHDLGGWAAHVGAAAFLEKPLDLVHLPERLRALLSPTAKTAAPEKF